MLSPRAARQHMRLSARSSHWMSGYQRVREVEGRQHAAGGAPARRHSRPGRLRSNVFVHEDLDVSHEEIGQCCGFGPVLSRWLRRVSQPYSSKRRSTSSSRILIVCWTTARLRRSSPYLAAAANSTKLLGRRCSELSKRVQSSCAATSAQASKIWRRPLPSPGAQVLAVLIAGTLGRC